MSSDPRHVAVTAVLSNIRSLRAYAREVDYEFLCDALEKLQSVIGELEDQHKEEQRKKQDELAKLEKVKNYIEEIGLDPSIIAASLGSVTSQKPVKKTRNAVPAKYRIEDADGNTYEWSGRGKAPTVFKKAFEQGKTKEEFLIKT